MRLQLTYLWNYILYLFWETMVEFLYVPPAKGLQKLHLLVLLTAHSTASVEYCVGTGEYFNSSRLHACSQATTGWPHSSLDLKKFCSACASIASISSSTRTDPFEMGQFMTVAWNRCDIFAKLQNFLIKRWMVATGGAWLHAWPGKELSIPWPDTVLRPAGGVAVKDQQGNFVSFGWRTTEIQPCVLRK